LPLSSTASIAEEIDPRLGRLGHEEAHGVVRVVLVADAVGAAQQHLQQDVGHGLAERGETLPGILVEEAHGHVEGGAAPALERQQLG
jgi:hypothetical protein